MSDLAMTPRWHARAGASANEGDGERGHASEHERRDDAADRGA